MLIKADRIAASKDGISIAAAATFIVNVVNTIHAKAVYGMIVSNRISRECLLESQLSMEINECMNILLISLGLTNKITSHDHNPQPNTILHQKHPQPFITQSQLHQINIYQSMNNHCLLLWQAPIIQVWIHCKGFGNSMYLKPSEWHPRRMEEQWVRIEYLP
jgi:hypothetical protein